MLLGFILFPRLWALTGLGCRVSRRRKPSYIRCMPMLWQLIWGCLKASPKMVCSPNVGPTLDSCLNQLLRQHSYKSCHIRALKLGVSSSPEISNSMPSFILPLYIYLYLSARVVCFLVAQQQRYQDTCVLTLSHKATSLLLSNPSQKQTPNFLQALSSCFVLFMDPKTQRPQTPNPQP